MLEPKTKAELIQFVEDGRTELTLLIGEIDESRMLEATVENDWSVKDILAHVTAWEQLMSTAFIQASAGQPPSGWPASAEAVDQLNVEIYDTNREKPLNEVLAAFDASYTRAIKAIQAMSEEALFDPDHFSWRQGRPLWHMVAGNTFGHYKEHIVTIENWLNRN